MRRTVGLLFALVAFWCVTPSISLAQQNWPQFRGADSMGVSNGGNLPDHWSATENVAWKIDLKGRGWSSPIVWGDKIFLTTVVNLGEDGRAQEGSLFRRRSSQAARVGPSMESDLPRPQFGQHACGSSWPTRVFPPRRFI